MRIDELQPEVAFVRGRLDLAAQGYARLLNQSKRASHAMAGIVCLACSNSTFEARSNAAALFGQASASLKNEQSLDLFRIIDSAVSFVFGEKFGMYNPLLLLYGNDERTLKSYLELAVGALHGGFLEATRSDSETHRAEIDALFGQTLNDLGVPLLAKSFLSDARDTESVVVAEELDRAERLIQLGFACAQIVALSPRQRLPTEEGEFSARLRHPKAMTRITAVFGKYIDGGSIEEEFD